MSPWRQSPIRRRSSPSTSRLAAFVFTNRSAEPGREISPRPPLGEPHSLKRVRIALALRPRPVLDQADRRAHSCNGERQTPRAGLTLVVASRLLDTMLDAIGGVARTTRG